MKKKKVILITNIISPYRISLFNYINQKGNFDFKVVALAEKEKNREWMLAKGKIKFDYQILPGWHLFFIGKRREVPIHLNIKVFKTLWSYKPDVVITSGYDCLAYWQAFFYCKLFRKRYILWNGTTLLSAGGIKGIRGIFKKIIIQGADKYIAYGSKAKQYLEYFEAKPENIYISKNTVDVDYFYKKVRQYRQGESFLKGRKKYPSILLLYVGQLIERKGVNQVLKALDKLKDPEIGFIIVGSGPEEENLKKFCQEHNLQNVYFQGFQQQEVLPKYYALADILVFPSSYDVWGLVVNEALASGLYVLCSDRAGAAYDLIKEKWNGALFDPHNVEQLTRLIQETKEHIEEIRARREAISEHACREFSIERSARAFLEAIQAVAGRKHENLNH